MKLSLKTAGLLFFLIISNSAFAWGDYTFYIRITNQIGKKITVISESKSLTQTINNGDSINYLSTYLPIIITIDDKQYEIDSKNNCDSEHANVSFNNKNVCWKYSKSVASALMLNVVDNGLIQELSNF